MNPTFEQTELILEFFNISQNNISLSRTHLGGYEYTAFEIKGRCTNPHQQTINLLSSSLVYQVEVYEPFLKRIVQYVKNVFLREEPISIEIHDASFYNDEMPQDTTIAISFLQLPINKLEKLANMESFEEMIEFLRSTPLDLSYSPSKLYHRGNNPDRNDLIAIINEQAVDFQLKKVLNDDGFYDGYEFVGICMEDKELLSQQLVKHSKFVEYSMFAKGKKTRAIYPFGEYEEVCNLFTPPSMPKQSALTIGVMLEIEDLTNICKLKKFIDVISYLLHPPKQKVIDIHPYLVDRGYDLNY